jgi:RNA 3'-terminal phosphate cyclase
LAAELDAGVTADIHAADQLLIYLALARGSSRFSAREFSSHARTSAWLIEQFLPVRITARPHEMRTVIEVVHQVDVTLHNDRQKIDTV